MKPLDGTPTGQHDLFKARLDTIIDMAHPLVKLAGAIDWKHLAKELGALHAFGPGQPPKPVRLMAGLLILQRMFNLSDEALCDRFIENPYYQYFCGEEFFRHDVPLDRSSLTNWRQRMGAERLMLLLQESQMVAIRSAAAKPADFRKVAIDTTVQEKAISHPTDAKLMHRARERLVKLADKAGLKLRQSYRRVGKLALIKAQRYAHARQFKRARREVRSIRTMLGRVRRDIQRQILGKPALEGQFGHALTLARLVAEQRQTARGKKIHSLHAPETECIGKGKSHKPWEFGVKVSVATCLHRSAGGQFVAHVATLPGNPYDGHTLGAIIPAIEKTTGAELARIVVDRGYRGHNAPENRTMRVYIQGQRRNVTDKIRKELNRRAAIEPVIGHMKHDTRMNRCHLKGAAGDAINAVLAAAGYNFRLLLRWFVALLCALIRIAISLANPGPITLRAA